MKRLLLLSCLILFACDTAVNDTASNKEADGPTNLGTDSKTTFSSSSEENSSSSELKLDGFCTPPTLSKNTVYFSKHGGIDTVDIGWARLYGGRDNDECKFIRTDHYVMEGNFLVKIESDYCKDNYCYSPNAYAYNNSYDAPVMKIECLWYSVAHISKDSLQVSVKKNETGEERSLRIGLFAGDCGGVGFTITQSASGE